MIQKKAPVRSCIGCGEKRDKKELIRIVCTPDGEYRVDPGGKMSGRGAYICRSTACLEKALKSKALARAFRTAVPPGVPEKLREEMVPLAER